MLRVVAELAAKARDVDIERLGRAEPVPVPDLVDEALAGDDAAGLSRQQLEKLELLAGQLHVPTTQARRPPAAVDPQRADLHDLRAFRCSFRAIPGPPQHRSDPRGHLTRAEGLDDVVVGAELEADDAVGLLAAGGEHDDGDSGALPKRASHVVARAVGERHVEEDEVRQLVAGRLDRVRHGAGDARVEPLAAERLRKGLDDRGLVLDHQDGAPARHSVKGRRAGVPGPSVVGAAALAAVAAVVVARLDLAALVVARLDLVAVVVAVLDLALVVVVVALVVVVVALVVARLVLVAVVVLVVVVVVALVVCLRLIGDVPALVVVVVALVVVVVALVVVVVHVVRHERVVVLRGRG